LDRFFLFSTGVAFRDWGVDSGRYSQIKKETSEHVSSVISDAQPAVSVIINNYNYARFLNAAIDSALNQRYPLIEIIVVDDGSTDDSREIILSYGDRITAIFKENGGQASALNAAVAASRGNILCFLDADDFYHPDKVVRVVDTFRQHGTNSKALLVHHLLRLTKEGSTELYSRPFGRTPLEPVCFCTTLPVCLACSRANHGDFDQPDTRRPPVSASGEGPSRTR
jgi:glycosyltransferase involved in cell wall biosynthesis